jgi:hypothetical protein
VATDRVWFGVRHSGRSEVCCTLGRELSKAGVDLDHPLKSARGPLIKALHVRWKFRTLEGSVIQDEEIPKCRSHEVMRTMDLGSPWDLS